MRVASALRVAGDSHSGLQRRVNEDRFHYDPSRGIFMVVDGVGGHAAGEQAADLAVSMLRARLERETGPVAERIREAITIANNEIYRRASLRPEWKGMACVLTVAVVENGRAVIGHVGDTRLYKLRHGRIEKITHDHSPVGEREDSHELSELEAMRHPRRNEVYRDVGSDPHDPADPSFIDIIDVAFEPDAAFLMCSDGLTDSIPSGTIADLVREYAGHPYEIVRALIDAANDAGGKDNVTVVYVEGERFAQALPNTIAPDRAGNGNPDARVSSPNRRMPRWVTATLVVGILAALGFAAIRTRELWLPVSPFGPPTPLLRTNVVVVPATGSIAQALRDAAPGTTVLVDPGEYREPLRLRSGVSVISRVPRQAIIRLNSASSEAEAAVVAIDVVGAEFAGFRIVGDAATPLGTGLFVREATVSITDIEISGAKNTAVEFSGGPGATMIGSEVHDNPGIGLAVRAGASPRIAHNEFAQNGFSQQAQGAVVVEAGARPQLTKNVFVGVRCENLPMLSGAECAANAFIPNEEPRLRTPARNGRRGGR